MHLTNTRSDICFAMNTLSQHLGNPRCVHLIVAKHVMRYLKGTIDFGLYYCLDFCAIDLEAMSAIELYNCAVEWNEKCTPNKTNFKEK